MHVPFPRPWAALATLALALPVLVGCRPNTVSTPTPSPAPTPTPVPEALVYVTSGLGTDNRQLTGVSLSGGAPGPSFSYPIKEPRRYLLSPDGRTLYALTVSLLPDRTGGTVRLAALDAATGETRRELLSPLRLDGLYPTGDQDPLMADMALVRGGKRLVLVMRLRMGGGTWRERLMAVDTETGRTPTSYAFDGVRARDLYHELTVVGDDTVAVQRTRVGQYGLEGQDLIVMKDGAEAGPRVHVGLGADSPLACSGVWWVSPDAARMACAGPFIDEARRPYTGVRVTALEGQPRVVKTLRLGDGVVDGSESTGYVSRAMVPSPDGATLYYVAPGSDPAVLKVDMDRMEVAGQVRLEHPLVMPTPTPAPTVSPEASATPAPTPTQPALLPVWAAVSEDGRRLLFDGVRLADPFRDALGQDRSVLGDGVLVVDTGTMTVLRHLEEGSEVWGAGMIARDGRSAYLVDLGTDRLVAVDMETGKVQGEVSGLADGPFEVAGIAFRPRQ